MFLHVPLNNKSSFKGRQNSSDQAGSMNHEQVSHITSCSVATAKQQRFCPQGLFYPIDPSSLLLCCVPFAFALAELHPPAYSVAWSPETESMN